MTKSKATAPETAGKARRLESQPKSKLTQLIALLERPEGATLEVMQAATGWQAHSVRGALSGSLKKAKGLSIASIKTDAGRVYRISGSDSQ